MRGGGGRTSTRSIRSCSQSSSCCSLHEDGLITQAKTDCHLKPYGHHTLEPFPTWGLDFVYLLAMECVSECVYVCECERVSAWLLGWGCGCVCGAAIHARCQNVKLIQRPDFGVDFQVSTVSIAAAKGFANV